LALFYSNRQGKGKGKLSVLNYQSGINEVAQDVVYAAQAQAEFSGKLTLGFKKQ